MAKLTRTAHAPILSSRSIRLRAALLYYNQGMTQKEISDSLGVSRSTVIRMLDEARKRAEVQIWINESPEDCESLAVSLEEKFKLDEAIVVPGQADPDLTAVNVGAALGRFLSEVIQDEMTIGVGWGRTLQSSLKTFRSPRRINTHVVSLLGGLVEARATNPIEYSWRLASQMDAECMLMLAPLVVSSPDIKNQLIRDCGLGVLFERARKLDLAVISCGDLGGAGTSLSSTYISYAQKTELLAAGAVCDTLCHFLAADGSSVDHPIQDCVMTVGLEAVAEAQHVLLATGGAQRVEAIRATMARTGCNTLITDEAAAMGLLGIRKAQV